MGFCLNVKLWEVNKAVKDMDFVKVKYWIQVHNMPFDMLTHQNGIIIGRTLRDLIMVDSLDWRKGAGKSFLRIRVEIDSERPLCNGFWVPRDGNDRVWAEVKYEKLYDFCFGCSRLGHQKRNCHDNEEVVEGMVNKARFGPWLRAAPRVVGANGGFTREKLDKERLSTVDMVIEKDKEVARGQQSLLRSVENDQDYYEVVTELGGKITDVSVGVESVGTWENHVNVFNNTEVLEADYVDKSETFQNISDNRKGCSNYSQKNMVDEMVNYSLERAVCEAERLTIESPVLESQYINFGSVFSVIGLSDKGLYVEAVELRSGDSYECSHGIDKSSPRLSENDQLVENHEGNQLCLLPRTGKQGFNSGLPNPYLNLEGNFEIESISYIVELSSEDEIHERSRLSPANNIDDIGSSISLHSMFQRLHLKRVYEVEYRDVNGVVCNKKQRLLCRNKKDCFQNVGGQGLDIQGKKNGFSSKNVKQMRKYLHMKRRGKR
ncbi:hypothetical protein REPUB_Repub19eG0050700 [Reevesia pubescens]